MKLKILLQHWAYPEKLYNDEIIYSASIGKKTINPDTGFADAHFFQASTDWYNANFASYRLFDDIDDNTELETIAHDGHEYDILTDEGFWTCDNIEGGIEIAAININSVNLGLTRTLYKSSTEQDIIAIASGNNPDSTVQIISKGSEGFIVPLNGLKDTFRLPTMHEVLDRIEQCFNTKDTLENFKKFCYDYNVFEEYRFLFEEEDSNSSVWPASITTDIYTLLSTKICGRLL